jgi:hypothetical protein
MIVVMFVMGMIVVRVVAAHVRVLARRRRWSDSRSKPEIRRTL